MLEDFVDDGSRPDSKDNSDETDCPKCGYTVSKKGLGSHKGSQRCEVIQDKNTIEEEGLVKIPQSSRMMDFLSESDFPVKTMKYRYNGNKGYNYTRAETVQSTEFTTKEGLEEARKNVLVNPSEKGIHLSVLERIDGGDVWVCEFSEEGYEDMPELVFVDVDTTEDVSRRRVAYVNPDNDIVFTTDGSRIGPMVKPENAEQIGVDSAAVISRII